MFERDSGGRRPTGEGASKFVDSHGVSRFLDNSPFDFDELWFLDVDAEKPSFRDPKPRKPKDPKKR